MAQKYIKYFYNKKNRRIAACFLFGGLWLKNSMTHILPGDTFFPMYGFSTKDSSIVEAFCLLDKCASDAGVKDKITPFVSRTTEVISAGFSAFGMGQSHIGIPRTFFCDTLEQISHVDIVPRKATFGSSNTPVMDKLDDNEILLMESLLLSEDAKRFSVARHVSFIKRNWAIYQSLIPSAFVVIGYSMVFHSPRLLFMRGSQPVSLIRIMGASLLGGLLAYVLCKMTKAAVWRKISVQADEDAASISPEFARGGIEMYDKLLSTNKALRVLFGKKGERMYSANGEKVLNPLFNDCGPPFSERKKYLASFDRNPVREEPMCDVNCTVEL